MNFDPSKLLTVCESAAGRDGGGGGGGGGGRGHAYHALFTTQPLGGIHVSDQDFPRSSLSILEAK